MNLNSTKVLITGGASGRGLGLCKRLHEFGAEIIVIDLDNERLR